MQKRSILVPLDFSDVTVAVLQEARRLAKAYKAEIRLIHVGSDSHRTGGMEFELVDYVNLVEARNATGRARLKHYASVLGHEGFRIQVSFAEGDARKAILAEAHTLNPTAIVLGAHSHGALHEALSGGVRQFLLDKGAWPVFVVPARHSASKAQSAS
jgi:nucleotide-binding universal stress UspA family protein